MPFYRHCYIGYLEITILCIQILCSQKLQGEFHTKIEQLDFLKDFSFNFAMGYTVIRRSILFETSFVYNLGKLQLVAILLSFYIQGRILYHRFSNFIITQVFSLSNFFVLHYQRFTRPILHGLCTLGFAVRAIVKCICGEDPNLVKCVSGRFLLHVYPGETLLTEMWLEGLR